MSNTANPVPSKESVKEVSSPAKENVELKVFVPDETTVTTIDGLKVKIPKISWKKEIQLISIIKTTLDEIGPAFSGDETNTMVNTISVVLQNAPKNLTKFASVVLDKTEEWIEENLDIGEIMIVVVPLLRQRLDLITSKINQYMPSLGVANQVMDRKANIPVTPRATQ